jgi:hypothetical protein
VVGLRIAGRGVRACSSWTWPCRSTRTTCSSGSSSCDCTASARTSGRSRPHAPSKGSPHHSRGRAAGPAHRATHTIHMHSTPPTLLPRQHPPMAFAAHDAQLLHVGTRSYDMHHKRQPAIRLMCMSARGCAGWPSWSGGRIRRRFRWWRASRPPWACGQKPPTSRPQVRRRREERTTECIIKGTDRVIDSHIRSDAQA